MATQVKRVKSREKSLQDLGCRFVADALLRLSLQVFNMIDEHDHIIYDD